MSPRVTKRLTALVCGCAVMLAAWPASGQSAPAQATPRAFVDLGAFADGDTTLNITPVGELTRRRALSVPGGALAAGVFVTQRVSLVVEVQLPARHTEDYPLTLLNCGGATCVPTAIDRRQSARTPTLVALVGYGWRVADRVRLSLLAGGGVAVRQNRLWNTPVGASRNDSPTFTTSETVPAVSYGVDVEVAVTPRVSLVPHLRGHRELGDYFTRGSMLRPGLMMRLRF